MSLHLFPDMKPVCPHLLTPSIIPKNWGHEEIIYNDLYCVKKLFFNNLFDDTLPIEKYSTSFHFHVHKTETLSVISGVLRIRYIDGQSIHHVDLSPSSPSFHITPGLVHQIQALYGPAVLLESSTWDSAEDSYRLPLSIL